jgi:hypothetical protein
MERRNRRSIVAMQFGSKNSYQNALSQLTWAQNPFDNFFFRLFFCENFPTGTNSFLQSSL